MTIKNYLEKHQNGTHEELLLEVCEKLYDLKIDFDQLEGNQFEILYAKVKRLEKEMNDVKLKMEK